MKSIVDLRHRLHRNAELSGCESETMNIIKGFIKENTSLEVADRGKYFYAFKYNGSNSRNIAFRADMDALPIDEGTDIEYCSLNKGVSHKCGHDGHCAMLCGMILEADKMKTDKNIYFLFQPAEETGKGSKICLDFIRKNNIDEIYGFHNIPGYRKNAVLLKYGTFACASTGIEISLKGKVTHAAYPEMGINPSFAAGEIIEWVKALNEKEHKGIVLATIVGVEIGEEAYGTSAGEGRVMITLRGEREDEYNDAKDSLCDFVKKCCEKYSVEFAINFIEEFGATINHSESVDKVIKCCEGSDIMIIDKPFRWSEDFGEYLKITKGAFIGIGDGEEYPGLHTQEYDFPDYIIETCINVMKGIVENG